VGKGDRKTRKGKRFIGSRRKRTKLNCYVITPKIQKKIMDYKQEIDNAIKNNIAEYADIFDFDDTPNKKLYKDLYLFCRENLDIHFKRKSISHSAFLYSNDFSVNAKVRIKKNQNTILINIGLIRHCIDKYLFNHALNDFIESKEPELAAKYDSSMSYLIFQLITQFTYYHELAHLFQYSQIVTEKELQERNSGNKFDIIRHKLEINADTYSSICIATHIHQYINKIFGDNTNQENVGKTITIFGACLLEYIINFTSNYELYYEEHSHPHPLIRLLNIILNITNHFSLIPTLREKGIELDANSLFINIINFHEELENSNVFTSGFSKSISQYVANIKRIKSYIAKIMNFGDNNEFTDAMSIWNKHVETLD
jgi:hypothetical protein